MGHTGPEASPKVVNCQWCLEKSPHFEIKTWDLFVECTVKLNLIYRLMHFFLLLKLCSVFFCCHKPIRDNYVLVFSIKLGEWNKALHWFCGHFLAWWSQLFIFQGLAAADVNRDLCLINSRKTHFNMVLLSDFCSLLVTQNSSHFPQLNFTSKNREQSFLQISKPM